MRGAARRVAPRLAELQSGIGGRSFFQRLFSLRRLISCAQLRIGKGNAVFVYEPAVCTGTLHVNIGAGGEVSAV